MLFYVFSLPSVVFVVICDCITSFCSALSYPHITFVFSQEVAASGSSAGAAGLLVGGGKPRASQCKINMDVEGQTRADHLFCHLLTPLCAWSHIDAHSIETCVSRMRLEPRSAHTQAQSKKGQSYIKNNSIQF